MNLIEPIDQRPLQRGALNVALIWTWLLIVGAVWLAVPSATGAGTNDFLVRVYTNAAKKTLAYRLLLPKDYDPKETYPVILYLHGGGAIGSDNAEPLNWGPLLFLEPAIRDKHKFFLVVPQCPPETGWLYRDFTDAFGLKEGEPLSMAIELVRTVLPKEYKIDPKRRYLTGVSMGGHAVWYTMARRPGFFAAAVPVCAAGEPKMVTKMNAQWPVWAFHSDDDHLVPVEMARDMIKSWRDHGGTAKYTEYTGLKHSSWKRAYADPAMFDWLFQQSNK